MLATYIESSQSAQDTSITPDSPSAWTVPVSRPVRTQLGCAKYTTGSEAPPNGTLAARTSPPRRSDFPSSDEQAKGRNHHETQGVRLAHDPPRRAGHRAGSVRC